jgi:hypothetical protein
MQIAATIAAARIDRLKIGLSMLGSCAGVHRRRRT